MAVSSQRHRDSADHKYKIYDMTGSYDSPWPGTRIKRMRIVADWREDWYIVRPRLVIAPGQKEFVGRLYKFFRYTDFNHFMRFLMELGMARIDEYMNEHPERAGRCNLWDTFFDDFKAKVPGAKFSDHSFHYEPIKPEAARGK